MKQSTNEQKQSLTTAQLSLAEKSTNTILIIGLILLSSMNLLALAMWLIGVWT
tara:strand:- start:262 stop:420 length:159 start_codon:yes stop_codon:yes gene_type:complete